MTAHGAVFTDLERAILVAIAEAALPAGAVFPAADARTVERVEAFFGHQPPAVQATYRGLLRLVDGAAWVTRRGGFASLPVAARLEMLEGWRRGGYMRANAVRALLVPLKMSHFDDPRLYRHIGCAYERLKPAPEAKPAWFRDRVHAAASLGGDVALECDVVVIGTGAGGAAAAKELAEAGVAVILLEEGDYADRQDFARRPMVNTRKLYRDGGATFSIGNTPIAIPLGRTVGGTTTVNSGTCFRTPDRVMQRWVDALGLDEFAPDQLAPYYERVEEILGVAPVPSEHQSGNARVIVRGADKLGYRHKPLQRNAPGCDGQGVCVFGCPTDAKRSTNVSYVPMALRAGAELYTGVRADRILVDGGRAAGVIGRTSSGARVTVRARAVVVACGSLLTPVFLMRNGLGGASGELGRNLSVHPAAACLGEMRERVEGWKGVPQGYSIDEFSDEGIIMEGTSTPLELTASVMSEIGPRMIELAESYDRVASFGLMIADTSRGRVRLVGGRSVVTYNVNDGDVARLQRGIERLSAIFFAAGASSVFTPVRGFDELRSAADLERLRTARLHARDLSLSAYHPLGTAAIGRDPRSSVLDTDHQLHDTPNLYVIDGSAIPSALGVNPQVTIMALATRAAHRLAARLS
ncbi:MAG TPA: GMC family oxidoreductase [Kofleriaceae bacterium]|jgi:choline dehydrogenase-like flavoprotein